jgi:hypothetical protein
MSAEDDESMSLVIDIRARCSADRLDAALIDGAEPAGSRELTLRAQRLTSPAFRAALATRLEKAVGLSFASRFDSRAVSSAVVWPPAAIAQLAGPAVRGLARRLRTVQATRPRGVALALRLVTDGASPLYLGPSIDDVAAAIREIEAAL